NAVGLLSCYDRHADRTGCTHSSWLRPIVNFRSDYTHPYIRGPHQFSGDMYITDWLRALNCDFDVITDHDLHQGGADVLAPYDVLLTGSHPEYVSAEILDAIDVHIHRGGNVIHLGGNAFHCVSTIYPDAPHVLELRRGHAGGIHWKSAFGEDHHAATGEPGGLWMLRNRAAQRTFGVGTASVTFGKGEPYTRTPESHDERYAWIFEGIDGDTIDARCDLLDGPAGFEYDRMDHALGSPPETVLLASARFAEPATEYTMNDARWTGCDAHNQADMILIEGPGRGSMFAVGSVAWTSGLF
ncbi:MAG: N,N-dimethylformamidase beta subunit family domain-containing protein, partial [Sphingomonadales bacterium]